MSKTSKTAPRIFCDRYRKHLRAFNSFDKNIYRTVKKVVVSEKICSYRGDKSLSTGVINGCTGTQRTTSKKIAKSDPIFGKDMKSNTKIDYCKNCGDQAPNLQIKSDSNGAKSQTGTSDFNTIEKVITRPKNIKKPTNKNYCESNSIQQYYRNENFNKSSDSICPTDHVKKASLNTIIEHPEKISSSDSIFEIYPEESEEEIGFMDPENIDNIKELKMFRNNNYFECHSAKSRMHSKGSVTSLNGHKCIYRFYLNDRLFPVPLNTDHQGNIRCIDCYLPLQNDSENSNINGTVQAKVKLNGEIQDTLLMLPVRNSLIVKERRTVLQQKQDYDSLYFGIIKLDLNGNSIFNRNLPDDSLALRYQKGYKELSPSNKYEYNHVQQDEVIII